MNFSVEIRIIYVKMRWQWISKKSNEFKKLLLFHIDAEWILIVIRLNLQQLQTIDVEWNKMFDIR